MQPSVREDRVGAVDIARGLAITGVVLNHAIDGVSSSGLLADDSPLITLNEALYVFRMPALAFTLGLFIPPGAAKSGRGRYILRRTRAMLWVFLLWTLLQGSIQVVLSRFTNSQTTVIDVLSIWAPLGQLWFLPAVITTTAAVVLLRTWGTTGGLIRATALFIPAVALWGATPNISGARGFALVGFVALGAAVGLRGARLLSSGAVWVWAIVFAASAVSFFAALITQDLVASTVYEPSPLGTKLWGVAAALLGVLALVSASVLIDQVPIISSALRALGTQTMPIYLMHILILAGTRIVLDRLGFNAEIILTVAMPLAILVPYVIGRYATRLHVTFLFEPPRRLFPVR